MEIPEKLKSKRIEIFTKGRLRFEGIVTGIEEDFIEILDDKTRRTTLVSKEDISNMVIHENDRPTDRQEILANPSIRRD
jgi:hypothetical protein